MNDSIQLKLMPDFYGFLNVIMFSTQLFKLY